MSEYALKLPCYFALLLQFLCVVLPSNCIEDLHEMARAHRPHLLAAEAAMHLRYEERCKRHHSSERATVLRLALVLSVQHSFARKINAVRVKNTNRPKCSNMQNQAIVKRVDDERLTISELGMLDVRIAF